MAQGATRKRKRNRKPPVQRLRRFARALFGVLVALSLLGMLGLAGWRLLELPVERVIVSGELKQVSREELMALISGSLEGGFLWADLQSVRQPLEQLPWVYRVVVKRRWPNSLEIRVMEQRAIARWGEDAFLNHTGEVFRPEGFEPIEVLPRLAGPDGSEGRLMQYYMLVQEQLQADGLQLTAISMNARGGLSARLQGGAELVFGRGDIEAKLARFLRVYESRLVSGRQAFARIDLRYSHGVAVAWAGGATINNKHNS
jgi:cell division protein FtsQ